MVEERKVLSPRQAWVPSCFGGFGCADTAGENDFDVDIKTTRSAPILILKGLGTMTLGRLGEKNYILKDDIVTWKQRIEDSLFVGWITYTTRSSLPDELHELAIDTKYVSRADEAKLSIVAVDDIEECSAYDVVHRLTAKEGASKTLLQVLQVLDVREAVGCCWLLFPPVISLLSLNHHRNVTFLEHSDLSMTFFRIIMPPRRRRTSHLC